MIQNFCESDVLMFHLILNYIWKKNTQKMTEVLFVQELEDNMERYEELHCEAQSKQSLYEKQISTLRIRLDEVMNEDTESATSEATLSEGATSERSRGRLFLSLSPFVESFYIFNLRKVLFHSTYHINTQALKIIYYDIKINLF